MLWAFSIFFKKKLCEKNSIDFTRLLILQWFRPQTVWVRNRELDIFRWLQPWMIFRALSSIDNFSQGLSWTLLFCIQTRRKIKMKIKSYLLLLPFLHLCLLGHRGQIHHWLRILVLQPFDQWFPCWWWPYFRQWSACSGHGKELLQEDCTHRLEKSWR